MLFKAIFSKCFEALRSDKFKNFDAIAWKVLFVFWTRGKRGYCFRFLAANYDQRRVAALMFVVSVIYLTNSRSSLLFKLLWKGFLQYWILHPHIHFFCFEFIFAAEDITHNSKSLLLQSVRGRGGEGIQLIQKADCRPGTKCWLTTECRLQTADRKLQTGYKTQTDNLNCFFVGYVITSHLTTYRASRNRFFAIIFHDHLHYCEIFLARFLISFMSVKFPHSPILHHVFSSWIEKTVKKTIHCHWENRFALQ